MAFQVDKHSVVEIVHQTNDVVGGVDNLVTSVKVISAAEAFRSYNWLAGTPVLNSVGTLTGRVVSARWNTVFQVSSKVGKYTSDAALIASLAVNIAQSSSRIDAIMNSNDSWDVKGAKLSTQVSSICIKTLTGVVPAGADLVTAVLTRSFQLTGAIINDPRGSQQVIGGVKKVDAVVNTVYNKVTDGDSIYSFLNVYIAPVASVLLSPFLPKYAE